MSRLKKELLNVHNRDVYSLILFILFKLRDLPEYSTLSELIYTLDKENFLKLCEYFGGMTVKIPTIDELDVLVKILMLYQYINIDGEKYEYALKLLECDREQLKKVKEDYPKVVSILERYSLIK